MLGAAGAQFSQAAGSLVVAVLSMRQPDLHLFGTLSVLLGALVVATSISTGLVGDTLTVLDRHDPATRTALRRLLLLVVGLAAPLGAAAAFGSGLVGGSDALLFGALVAVWVAEDVLRRLLMACLRFWRVVVVDLTHLVTVLGVLATAAVITGRPPDLGWYLIALVGGQVAASVPAVAGLPSAERYLGPVAPGRFAAVLRYGGHRALQGLLRPATLLLMRVAVMAGCGSLALARLETGRVVTSPALLLVSGGGTYLLSRYAVGARRGDGGRRVEADRAALVLAATTVVTTVAVLGVTLAVPQALGTAVADLSRGSLGALVAVWGGYVLAVAVAMPYTSLGAVRVAQARLLKVRSADTALQVAVGALLLGFAPDASLFLPSVTGVVSVAVTLTALRPLVADACGARDCGADCPDRWVSPDGPGSPTEAVATGLEQGRVLRERHPYPVAAEGGARVAFPDNRTVAPAVDRYREG